MSHCLDYYRKWKREHNFCGLRKQDAKDIDSYLTLVERISQVPTGLESDFVFDHFTAGAARPLIRCKDPEASTKALNYVIACLKRGEDVTGGDLQATIEGFVGKKPVKSTHLRTLEQVKGPIEQAMEHAQRIVDANKPILSLAAQQAAKCPAGGCKDEDTCPAACHVNPGPAVMVNPVIINDTHRERPFQTAAQLMVHDKDPLEVGKMFQAAAVEDLQKVPDSVQNPKEEMEKAAEVLYHLIPEWVQKEVDELISAHSNWKIKDVFCLGPGALLEKEARGKKK